ncbi:Na+/H+ antiporter subunit E [Azonexus hydrophilus]|uniref:Na+/H+ antiporter subunit E n=1 Tax=Azonexus hydrophilus TaxID=418702 RepID=UPI0003FB9261|nr:Na+/H+ antiporter subunit E [Azonexus hydrophilus]
MPHRQQTSHATTSRSALRRGAIFALLWLAAAEGNLNAWPLALAGVAGATAASLWLLPAKTLLPISAGGLLRFLVWFVRQSLAGGIQVAGLALQRQPALRPALIEVPLTLPPGLPRLLFTAALSLMPGTLGVRLQGDTLLVHVLDRRQPLADDAARLANRVAAVFREAR